MGKKNGTSNGGQPTFDFTIRWMKKDKGEKSDDISRHFYDDQVDKEDMIVFKLDSKTTIIFVLVVTKPV